MALSSSAFRQTAPTSVVGYHQTSGESFGIVTEIEANYEQNLGLHLSNVNQPDLNVLVKQNEGAKLVELGGVKEIANSLKTNVQHGIRSSIGEILIRRRTFGSNFYVEARRKSFVHLLGQALNHLPIVLLLISAVVSLALGISKHGPKQGWYDGGSILISILVSICVSAYSNSWLNRQHELLSEEKEKILVEVVRDGTRQWISIFDIVVGDVVCLKTGDQVPADGLFIDGLDLEVDEYGTNRRVLIGEHQESFLVSGSYVVNGYATILVTAVGMNTKWGETMSSRVSDPNVQMPLQARLNRLASLMRKIGLLVAFMIFALLLVRYFTGNTKDQSGNKRFKGSKTSIFDLCNAIVGFFITAVMIIVVAIPEGLIFALKLTVLHSMKGMMDNQTMVRNSSAFEAIGFPTTICTEINGALCSNWMKVSKSLIGKDSITEKNLMEENVLELFVEGISITRDIALKLFRCAPIDDAIHTWTVLTLSGMEMHNKARCLSLIRVEASPANKKRIGVVVQRELDSTISVHWRGDAEGILSSCSHYYEMNGSITVFNDEDRELFRQRIENMTASGLQCIALAHKHILIHDRISRSEKIPEDNLTLLALMGLKGFCHPGTKHAIEACQLAGVKVIMVTKENITVARSMAMEYGLLSLTEEVENEGSIVTGNQFRDYDDNEAMEIVGNIRIMAKSYYLDKLAIVRILKKNDHVVVVTGDNTTDALSLKEADIGVAMGVESTQMAKESSDIVVRDGNFVDVVEIVRWRLCIHSNIQKFLQFQLTTIVATLVINLVAAAVAGEVPLTVVQLLWLHLVVGTLGALALATEKPTKKLMENQPGIQNKSLISNLMWGNLLSQALYQIAVVMVLQFKGVAILGISSEKVNDTMIFNTFVLCQMFNEFNARMLKRKNVFKGIHRNKIFLGIIGITVVLQVAMVEFLKKFADTQRLNMEQWGVCIAIAAVSWPIGWLVKFTTSVLP
ncbi:hypothetical protein BUALT_Bualt14G0101900 [Buddleja alternifolia]|uniref:Calcium-transporting ATPase n=1 Tax=Buddleja alternifolia TaxID=168488 RepID=A0AAV6WJE9_9LAMI|nr:hypothetical protein BUALT_Bualt14G0101900 [Buddleja alternifolia]